MIGVFRFYQDGELVAESPNVITTEGKRLILRYLAGLSASLGDAIGIGTSAVPSAATDTRLGFEIDRIRVDLKSADYTNNLVIYKGTISQAAYYTIYEMGLWSKYTNDIAGQYGSKMLTDFNLNHEVWSNVVADTTGVRTSADGAKVSVSASSTVSVRNSSVQMDLSGFTAADQFLLAFYKPDNNIVGITFAFEDQTTGGSLKTAEQNISALPVGYNVIAVTKSGFTQTGTISWGSINRYGFDVRAGTSGSSITLDALRVEDTDTVNRDYVLISHSILSTPLAKTNAAPMDVEYALDFTVT